MQAYCNTTDIGKMYKKGQCKDIVVLPSEYCFEITYADADTLKYFQPEKLQEVLNRLNGSIMTHVWNSVVKKCGKNCTVKKDTVAALTYLARLHCPKTYEVAESF
jgi:hypothetical protein